MNLPALKDGVLDLTADKEFEGFKGDGIGG
jgi:hypothetical protein